MKIDRTKGAKKKRKKKKNEDYKIRTMREGMAGIDATWLDREGAFNPPVISKL